MRPLRASVRFRWLYASQLGSQLARPILVVAVPYQIFVLTGSTWLVGMVGLAQLAPLIFGSLLGGAAADVVDRRRLLMVVQILLAGSGVGLAANAGRGSQLWPIFALIAVNAGLFGVESPTKTSIVPALVPRDLLASAFALYQVLNQAAQVIGPALAGVLIARFGIGAAYGTAAALSLLTAAAMVKVGSIPHPEERPRITVASALGGWRYLRTTALLRQTLLIDLTAMILGAPRALFPAFGTTVLGGDAATVGLLYAAPGAGALAGALTTGWVSRVRRQGRAVIFAVGVWGLSLTGFGLARSVPAALAMLALSGAADMISAVFRNTILQLAVPDSLRGRLTAIHTTVVAGGPHLGDVRAGALATATSPAMSAVSGGVASVLGAAVVAAWRGRDLWRQSADHLPSKPVIPDGRLDPPR